MIVKMRKTYVAARRDDRDRLLDVLRDLGVIHLAPVDPARAIAEEKTVAAVDQLGRALQILSTVEPAGEQPDISAVEAAAEVLDIQRKSAEGKSRLGILHLQIQHLDLWGDVRLEQFTLLREAGVDVRFYFIDPDLMGKVEAECVQTIGPASGKKVLIAVIDRTGEATIPDEADPVPLPKQDRPSLIAEAGEIDASFKDNARRLDKLAHLADAMQSEYAKLREHAEFTRAQHSGLTDGGIYALQGWVPADKAESLDPGLRAEGIDAAVETSEPAEGENPPTLIQYPRWARPIKGLFDILGTLPGYKEIDLSPFFMIALPLFAAMLIGDAGYGLIFILVPLVLYRRLTAVAGKAKTHLIIVIGISTLIWGVLSANYFGITPDSLALGGGYSMEVDGKTVANIDAMLSGTDGWAAGGRVMVAAAPIWSSDAEATRNLLMKIAFIIGTIHLTLAQLRKALWLAPDPRALASVGWAVFLWGILVIVWYLMFIGVDKIDWSLCGTFLGIGYLPVLLFSSPHRNPLKRILAGLGGSLLPMLGTFSDTMSYIRLMAVGLASYYIAAAFNGLGASLADAATWFAAAPVIIFGHLLNIGLAILAVFAHGVRLNMLEFSNNAGVQWAGHAYEPFTTS